MKSLIGLVVAVVLVLASCVLPIGTTAKHELSLKLSLDGPATSQVRSVGRIVTPDTSTLLFTFTDGKGATVLKTSVTWDVNVSGGEVTTVNLKEAPAGVPLTLTVKATSSDGTATGQGSTKLTLKDGVNAVNVFLVPVVPSANALSIDGAVSTRTLAANAWELWKFTTPASQTAFEVTIPTGATGYLQSPTGALTVVYLPKLSVAAEAGTWNLLLWNRASASVSDGLGLKTSAAPSPGYTLSQITFPDVGDSETMNLEARLYDRPYARSDKKVLQSRAFTVTPADGEVILSNLNWSVGPQQSVGFVALADGVVDKSAGTLLDQPVTTDGEILSLYCYDGEDDTGVFVALRSPAAAPQNLVQYLTVNLQWTAVAGAVGYKLRIDSTDSNSFSGELNISSSTTLALNGTPYLYPYGGTPSTYKIRAYYLASDGTHHYYGPFSSPVSFINNL